MTGMMPALQRSKAKTIPENSCALFEVSHTNDQVIDHFAHLTILACRQAVVDSLPVKRLSPLLILAAATALVVAVLKNSDQPSPPEDWQPVDPS
jgi:hypothetical protein